MRVEAFCGAVGDNFMWRSLGLISLVVFFVFLSDPGFALEPTLVDGIDRAWRTVQGNADGNPLVVFDGDLTGGKVPERGLQGSLHGSFLRILMVMVFMRQRSSFPMVP